MNNNLLDAALYYAGLGYPVFPCSPGKKAPCVPGGVKSASLDPEQIRSWWAIKPDANIGLSTDGLLVVDIDGADNPWLVDDTEKQADFAASPLAFTPRGGRHYFFLPPAGTVFKNSVSKLAPKVDTRSAGGYVLVAPSVVGNKPYGWADGEALGPRDGLPLVPSWICQALSSDKPTPPPPAPPPPPPLSPLPSEVERRAIAYLAAMPPSISGEGGHNALFAAATVLVHGFLLNPAWALRLLEVYFNPRCLPPWSARELEHKVNDAATKPHDLPAGWLLAGTRKDPAVDLHAFLDPESEHSPPLPPPPPPVSEIPERLLRVPGLISEVQDLTLSTAPYPNLPLAFAGALALQAFLSGRVVRDDGDNRTNLYILSLANSACGKDWPRKINSLILQEAKMAEGMANRIASGEGLQDALARNPRLFVQTDEFDTMLQQMANAKDARFETLLSNLLELYSSANASISVRLKAGRDASAFIHYPTLILSGAAIPVHFYRALNERFLTNGLVARMIIVEASKRGAGQEPSIPILSARIVEACSYWYRLCGSAPMVSQLAHDVWLVQASIEAKKALQDGRMEAEREYDRCESRQDAVGMTVWGRVSEHTRKLALIYACSECYDNPLISLEGVRWAEEFVNFQARRMLQMAELHVAESEFDSNCLKLLRKIDEYPGRKISHSVALKRMRMDAKSFRELVDTMTARGDLEVFCGHSGGRSTVEYARRREDV